MRKCSHRKLLICIEHVHTLSHLVSTAPPSPSSRSLSSSGAVSARRTARMRGRMQMPGRSTPLHWGLRCCPRLQKQQQQQLHSRAERRLLLLRKRPGQLSAESTTYHSSLARRWLPSRCAGGVDGRNECGASAKVLLGYVVACSI
jgi:hypothetical protein